LADLGVDAEWGFVCHDLILFKVFLIPFEVLKLKE
jgi:hypothetical protein